MTDEYSLNHHVGLLLQISPVGGLKSLHKNDGMNMFGYGKAGR